MPFNLTQSRTFDILGSISTPSVSQFRWDAALGKYEVLAPGYADWSRLEALQPQSGGRPFHYTVFGSGETRLPFDMHVDAYAWPQLVPANVGRAWYSGILNASFAFGIATAPGDVPVSGTMTCGFGEDEIGGGNLTFDLAAGTVSGWAEPFYGNVRYQLVQTSFAPGATTFATTFGTDGVLEGRFFGPRAVNVAVRAKGGGESFAAGNGIMLGGCKG